MAHSKHSVNVRAPETEGPAAKARAKSQRKRHATLFCLIRRTTHKCQRWSLPQSCLTPTLIHNHSFLFLLSTYYAAGSGLDMNAIKMGQPSPQPCAKSPLSRENTVFTCNPHNQLRSCGRGSGCEGGVTVLCGRYQGRAVPPVSRLHI